MKLEHLELLKRLEACSLDDAAAAFPFSERLARDHHWPLEFARRVIREYKRFAFLAVAAGHPVSPSHAVDEAWHLHLLYTQSYWKDFCGEVLQTSLHHQPTKGGVAERIKFDSWYGKTLASYRQFFGEQPPRDIWPKRNEHPVRVHFDPETHWLVPKPRTVLEAWRSISGQASELSGGGMGRQQGTTWVPAGTAVLRVAREFLRLCLVRPAVPLWLLMLVLFVAGCGPNVTALVSPFDLKGPEFLSFYFISLAVVCMMAVTLRWHLRQPADAAGGSTPELDPYAVTYLAGGRGLAISAALTSLCQRGAIRVSSVFGRLAAVKPLSDGAHSFERGIYDLVAWQADTVKAVRENAAALTTPIAERLKEQGLVVPDRQARIAMLAPLLLAAVVPLMGGIKILIGVERHRPVGFLVAACILSLIGIAVGFARRPLRSRRGDAVLNSLRNRHGSLRATVRNPLVPDNAALPMAIGLFGMGILAGTQLDDLRTKLQPTASGSSCGSGCGGSSCGGGGGGGGGCGGCGGGD